VTPSIASLPVKTLLNPRSVAVIGASEDQTKFGGRLYKTLLQHQYGGVVYPINPGRDSLFGIKTYPSVSVTPKAPDMVVMALPRDKVKDEIAACAARGARAGIIITSKFSDAGPEGLALEREVVAVAAERGMRLIGPNCLGLISPANKLVLCSSPAVNVPRLIEAPIGFVSQSGALMGTLFDRSHGMGIGFSHCVSVGNQADLELNDFVEFLIDDERTQVICSYVEGIKTPGRLVDLARRARAAGKPWLMVKAGATEDGRRAAYSHTASLAGDFAALKAICERENVVLMDDPLNMLSLARAMVRHPNRRVRNVAVFTTSGGGGAITADQLARTGIGLTRFAHHPGCPGPALLRRSGANPIDIGGRKPDATREIGTVTAELALADPGTDLGLMVLTTAPDVPGSPGKWPRGPSAPPRRQADLVRDAARSRGGAGTPVAGRTRLALRRHPGRGDGRAARMESLVRIPGAGPCNPSGKHGTDGAACMRHAGRSRRQGLAGRSRHSGQSRTPRTRPTKPSMPPASWAFRWCSRSSRPTSRTNPMWAASRWGSPAPTPCASNWP
jgi:acetyl-CoA synthetase (ADP-forming)